LTDVRRGGILQVVRLFPVRDTARLRQRHLCRCRITILSPPSSWNLRVPYRLRVALVWGLFACAAIIVGCGPGNELGRRPVSGTVTLDGQPLERGSISFQPVGDGTSSGATIENGTFSIPEQRGLPPGTYTVRIYSSQDGVMADEIPGEIRPPRELIPSDWNTDSKHQIEVNGGDNTFTFDIQSK
jgi:hypothetical protein